MSPPRLWIAIACAFSLFATACAPGLSDLIGARQYREALCLAVDARREAISARVMHAMLADAQAALHLQVVRPAELRVLVGDLADPIAERVSVVRLRYDANRLDVDRWAMLVDFGWEEGRLAPLRIDRETLSAMTGEALPRPRLVTQRGGRRPAQHGAAGALVLPLAFIWDLSTLFTTGATKAAYDWQFPKRPDHVFTRHPRPEEFARLAPKAEALYRVLRPRRCEAGPGAPCDYFMILPRSQAGPPDRIWLRVFFISERLDDRGRPRGLDCFLQSAPMRVELPPGDDLGQRLERLFGGRMRTLEDLSPRPESAEPPWIQPAPVAR